MLMYYVAIDFIPIQFICTHPNAGKAVDTATVRANLLQQKGPLKSKVSVSIIEKKRQKTDEEAKVCGFVFISLSIARKYFF